MDLVRIMHTLGVVLPAYKICVLFKVSYGCFIFQLNGELLQKENIIYATLPPSPAQKVFVDYAFHRVNLWEKGCPLSGEPGRVMAVRPRQLLQLSAVLS